MLNPIFSKKVQGQKHPGRWGIVEHQIPSIKMFKTNTKSHKHPSIRFLSKSKTQLVNQRKQKAAFWICTGSIFDDIVLFNSCRFQFIGNCWHLCVYVFISKRIKYTPWVKHPPLLNTKRLRVLDFNPKVLSFYILYQTCDYCDTEYFELI